MHAESNEWDIELKQMLTEVLDRGRKLYSVDESCIPWTEVVLQTVNGNSLASFPSPLSKNQN